MRPERRRLWTRFRSVKVAAVLIVAMACLAAAGLFLFTRLSLPPKSQTISDATLTETVTILRDRHWVPHIYAENLPDAFFALGFVHAQDRMWQMESMRRFASGRLAEIFGPEAVASDRWMRTLGLKELVEAEVAALSKDARTALDAYTSGVNTWLKHRAEILPPEFYLFRYRPEPWESAHSLYWLKVMAMSLAGNYREELLKARLQHTLTPEQLADLWPGLSETPPLSVHAPPPIKVESTASGANAVDPFLSATRFGASNAWAVSGRLTSTGRPLLANDPHLSLQIPSQWYLAHVVTPDAAFAGATAPGFPFLILGQNRHIAWGVTGPEADVEDLIIERLTPDSEAVPGTTAPESADLSVESIVVRGQENEALEIQRTSNGPIISKLLDLDWGSLLPGRETAPDTFAVSLAATYLQPDDRTAEAAFQTTIASSKQEFLSALDNFHSPLVNCIFADLGGTIGLRLAGRLPIRRTNDGFGPIMAAKGEAEWLGFVPTHWLPQTLDPAEDWVINANNRNVPAGFPWYASSGWGLGLRAARIEALLRQDQPLSLDRMTAVQLDVVSPAALRLLPLMLAGLPDDIADEQTVEGLRAWSGTMSAEAWQPTVFAAWWRAFDEAVFADELGPAFAEFQRPRPRLTENVLLGGGQWCDDVTTPDQERCGDQLLKSFRRATSFLSERLGGPHTQWRWGRVHIARFRNRIIDEIPLVGRYFGLAFPTDGGWDTINRGAYAVANGAEPFAHVHGAGYRAVYDLASPERSRFMIATGQSGNPLSRYYTDLAPPWRDGQWIELFRQRRDVERGASANVTFLAQ
ncbi:MAG: penicillin acylase family protein [Hyphomicrobiales bacterium]|nr:penicillin acylase family protein [Hyphomicrobiales bacterium]